MQISGKSVANLMQISCKLKVKSPILNVWSRVITQEQDVKSDQAFDQLRLTKRELLPDTNSIRLPNPCQKMFTSRDCSESRNFLFFLSNHRQNNWYPNFGPSRGLTCKKMGKKLEFRLSFQFPPSPRGIGLALEEPAYQILTPYYAKNHLKSFQRLLGVGWIPQ